MNFLIHTFGCKVNTYDSGLLHHRLSQLQGSNHQMVHILNTCAVTEEATKEAIRLARKIKAQNPLALVVATGCAAQVDNILLEQSPAIDLIVANSHKGQLSFIIDQYFKNLGQIKKTYRSNIFKKDDLEAGGGIEPNHRRVFLKIQDGCNAFCSFCIIPYARGLSRSVSVSNLVKRVQELVDSGIQEVVLTGVHIGDYRDQNATLDNLVENILVKTTVPRLRLTSLEPIEISDRLLELYTHPRMCRHFHLSIQSASTSVLQAMKRRYTQKHVVEILNRIQQKLPDAFVGMDVIAGFPSETDADFLNTYQVLAEHSWTKLHVFPYSERKGTRAAQMEQMPVAVRKSRARRLRELSNIRFEQVAEAQKKQTKWVLFLHSADQAFYRGMSRDYWTVLVPKSDTQGVSNIETNTEYPVQVIAYQPRREQKLEGYLIGQLLHQPVLGK